MLKLLLLLTALTSAALAGRHERRLLRHLFEPANRTDPLDAHNPMERPVKNESDAVYVWFRVSLNQIVDLDEKNEILVSNFWLDMTWHDYHFMWDPKDFGGIKMLIVDPSGIWKPDILLYNSADEKIDGNPTKAVIEYNGNMNFIPPSLSRSICKIDTTWFPFDTQVCKLKFGSWSYHGGALDLRLKCLNDTLNTAEKRLKDPLKCSDIGTADLENYIPNSDWSLEGMEARRTALEYDCCPYPFIDVSYTVRLRRRTLYYGINLIIPCVLISATSGLTFLLPPEAGEKITLGVISLVLPTVFHLLVARELPSTSLSVPLIQMYFLFALAMSAVSLLFTVIVLNCHHMDAKSHPALDSMRKFICNDLSRILFMKNENIQREGDPNQSGGEDARKEDGDEAISAAIRDEVRVAVAVTRNISDANSTNMDIRKEWKFAARVVDRFCFVIFFGVFTFITLVIFLVGASRK